MKDTDHASAAFAQERAKNTAGAASCKDCAPSRFCSTDVLVPRNPIGLLLGWAGVRNRIIFAASIVLALIGVAGSIVPFYAVGQMIVGVIALQHNFGFYLRWCGAAAAGYGIYVIFHYISTTISHIAAFSTIAAIRRRVADKLTRVPLGYVVDTPSGRLKNSMVEKVESIEPTLAHLLPEMTSNLLVPLAVVAYMFVLDWRMALVALVPFPIGLVGYLGVMKDYKVWYGKVVKAAENMNSTSVEYINGIEVIKAFGRSASSYEKFSEGVYRYTHSFIDWMSHTQMFQAFGMALGPATLVTVLPVGCLFILQKTLDPAVFILIAVLSLAIFPSLYAAMNFIDTLAQIGSVVGEIDEILTQPEQRRGLQAAQQQEKGTIELKEVYFSYGKEQVIKGVNLAIQPNQVCALVGPSGSGKSTLARLIAGFWDPDEGAVKIGGVSLEKMSAASLMEAVSFVDQDTYLFDESILDNIRRGRTEASDEEVIAAAQACGCHTFIMGLEQGYHTLVGQAGGHLSGGERQRVAIARAMLKDAPIIILDEATAYADPENEALINQAIGKLVVGKTLIVIAHRLSTIVSADKIVVVNKGRIEASGTHRELMSCCSLYADMYHAHIQSKDAA